MERWLDALFARVVDEAADEAEEERLFEDEELSFEGLEDEEELLFEDEGEEVEEEAEEGEPFVDAEGDAMLSAPRAVALERITALWEQPGALLAPYSDAQVAAGLDFLINPSKSELSFALLTEDTPLEARLKALRLLPRLYREVFAARCTQGLGALDEVPVRSLNAVCYMWWDVFPSYGHCCHNGASPALVEGLEAVFEELLCIPHDACVESALHGIGHHAIYRRTQCEQLIDAFLAREGERLRPALRDYAEQARTGRIL